MKECYKKDVFENIVRESNSIAEVIRKIGLRVAGGNFNTISKYIQLYNIDTSHFSGQTWNKGMGLTDYAAINKFEDILKKGTSIKTCTLKERLIAEGLKEYKCERCGNCGVWMGEKMTLEMHHINGDHFDNRLENLQILCPNCHSITDSYRGKRRKYNVTPNHRQRNGYTCKCLYCGNEFKSDRKNRKFCCLDHYRKYSKNISKYENPIKTQILSVIGDACNISDMARRLKTSRPTVAKNLKDMGLYEDFKKRSTNILRNKEVIQYDLNMNKIKEWKSVSDAEKTLRISNIGKCANLRCKSAGGFIWRFKR